MLAVNLSTAGEAYLVNGSRGVVVGWVDARAERAALEGEIQRLKEMLGSWPQVARYFSKA